MPHYRVDHLLELELGVDVQEREGRPRREKRFLGQVRHDRGVLTDRVEHHRVVELSDRLPDDVDALGLELLEVRE